MLYIDKHLMEELIAVAESVKGECCGFLFGIERLDDRIVTKTMAAINVADNKDNRFEIAPKEYLEAERYADQNGLRLLGIYHSHPDNPATPSKSDRQSAYPELSYVIISVTNQKFTDIRSWRLNAAAGFEEELINKNIN